MAEGVSFIRRAEADGIVAFRQRTAKTITANTLEYRMLFFIT
jgi:hypothetical protein